MTKHLWEVEHPYYGPEGDGDHYKSFKELLEEVGSADDDMNTLYRFDWEVEGAKNPDPNYRDGKLKLFYVLARKSIFWTPSCDVCAADEPEVIAFLEKKMTYLMKLWEPVEAGEK